MDAYDVTLEHRQVFDGMGYDSYWHADVIRRSDGKKIAVQRDWKWSMKRALKPKALSRAFAFVEAEERERVQHFTVAT